VGREVWVKKSASVGRGARTSARTESGQGRRYFSKSLKQPAKFPPFRGVLSRSNRHPADKKPNPAKRRGREGP